MRFVEVNELPKTKRTKKCDMEARLNEFMAMNIKIAKVDYNSLEYTCSESCKGAFNHSVRHYGLPIKVIAINGEVYLIRKDL